MNLAMQLIEAGLAEHKDTDRPIAGWLSQLDHLDRTRHLRIRIEQAPATLADRLAGKRARSFGAPAWFIWAVAVS